MIQGDDGTLYYTCPSCYGPWITLAARVEQGALIPCEHCLSYFEVRNNFGAEEHESPFRFVEIAPYDAGVRIHESGGWGVRLPWIWMILKFALRMVWRRRMQQFHEWLANYHWYRRWKGGHWELRSMSCGTPECTTTYDVWMETMICLKGADFVKECDGPPAKEHMVLSKSGTGAEYPVPMTEPVPDRRSEP